VAANNPEVAPGSATTPPVPVCAILPCSNCFFNIGFQIRLLALVNQFLSCFLSIPVFCIKMTWSWGVGYGCVKCSGDRSHDFKVATAPEGSSRLDFPVFPFLPPSSSSSSDAQLVGPTGFGGGGASATGAFAMAVLSWWESAPGTED